MGEQETADIRWLASLSDEAFDAEMARRAAIEEAEELAREEAEDAEFERLAAIEEAEEAREAARLDQELDDLIAELDEQIRQERKAEYSIEETPEERAERKRVKELKRAKKAAKRPAAGKQLKLAKTPTFSRVRVLEWGSAREANRPIERHLLGTDATVWTDPEGDGDDPFVTVDARGLLFGERLVTIPDDALVEILALPRYAGDPRDLIENLGTVKAPPGAAGHMVTPEGFHPLVWDNDSLHADVMGWNDPENSVVRLLCALAVAPVGDSALTEQLLAALRARYTWLRKHKDTYPPKDYPWRKGPELHWRAVRWLVP